MNTLRQVVRLGELADLGTRCDRRGRQRIARLIKQHGADMLMPQLALLLSADCPRSTSTDLAVVATEVVRREAAEGWLVAECGVGSRGVVAV